jgi:hypothetical protein
MKHSGRLPRTVKGEFVKRRLDLFVEKKELIKDILNLGGAGDIDVLEEEFCGFGEPLSSLLPSLSLPHLRRIHARLVTGVLPIHVDEGGL